MNSVEVLLLPRRITLQYRLKEAPTLHLSLFLKKETSTLTLFKRAPSLSKRNQIRVAFLLMG